MNILEWDLKLKDLVKKVDDAKKRIVPAHSENDYLSELENLVQRTERSIAELKANMHEVRHQNNSVDPRHNALLHWSEKFFENAVELVRNSSRICVKDLWLKIFQARYVANNSKETQQEQILGIISQQKKTKETESYLALQITELEQEHRRLEQIKFRHDTEIYNLSASLAMQSESNEFLVPELNAMNHLEKYLRYVQFISYRSSPYRAQIDKELNNINDKLMILLDKCRSLALDTIDFEGEGEKLVRKKRFQEFKDQISVLDHKLDKIEGMIQNSRVKSSHPVLKKGPKKANNSTVRNYRPTSLNELG